MTQELEKTVIETVSNFSERLIEAAGVVSEKLIDVAPDVADAMLTLVQVKGAWEVSTDFIFLMFFVLPFLFVRKIWRKVVAIESGRESYNRGNAYVPFTVFLSFLTIMSFIRLVYLLNFYNWISIFYPEGAIAIRALSSVGIEL